MVPLFMFMKSNNSFSKVKLAALAAAFIILTHGIAYYGIAARLDGHSNVRPIASDSLNSFPMQIGDWTGKKIPLDETLIRATDSDDLINRQYSRRNGQQVISFYMACGVNTRKLLSHHPSTCYPAGGWSLIDHSSVELTINDEMKLPCDIFQFSRGLLNIQTSTVLSYLVLDDKYGDSSLLRLKAWRRLAAVNYAWQIQIVADSAALNDDLSKSTVCSFAVDSAPFVAQLIDEIKKGHKSDNSVKALAGN